MEHLVGTRGASEALREQAAARREHRVDVSTRRCLKYAAAPRGLLVWRSHARRKRLTGAAARPRPPSNVRRRGTGAHRRQGGYEHRLG